MNRPDAILYSIAFYFYLGSFAAYILHVALKKDFFGKIGSLLVILGILPHTAAFFVRWSIQKHIPLANMYEYMGAMSWMVIIGLIYFIYKYKNHKIGVFISPVAVVMLVVASLLPSEINSQLMPALQSVWLNIHVIMAALGSGAFLVSFSAAALYLLSENDNSVTLSPEKQKKEWYLFAFFWVLLPVIVALILKISGLLPIHSNMIPAGEISRMNGSSVTSFAFISGNTMYYMGRMAIGLGIGLVISSILWPLAYSKIISKGEENNSGSRYFLVTVISLLLAAIVVGFMIQRGMLVISGRSYFKIFEFFGPTLVFSWVLIPILNVLLQRSSKTWIKQLGLKRPVFEEISYAAVAIGYPLYTIGALFAGAIWAEQAWGTWWSWDPKEVGAFIIWLFYTAFLHARYQRQWKGTRAQILIVLGMVFVFVSFFGNYFFGGLHSFEVT